MRFTTTGAKVFQNIRIWKENGMFWVLWDCDDDPVDWEAESLGSLLNELSEAGFPGPIIINSDLSRPN